MEAIDRGALERILVTLLCEVYPTGCTTLELARKLGTRANRQHIKKAANQVLYNSALQKGYIVNTGGDPPRWGATPQAVAVFTRQPDGQPMAVKPQLNSAVPCNPTVVSSFGVQPMPMPPEAVRQTAVPPMVVERGSLKQAPAPAAIHYKSEGTDTIQTEKQLRATTQTPVASSPHIQQGFPQVGMHPIRDIALQGAPLMVSNVTRVPQAPQSASLQDQGIIGLHGVMLSNPMLSQNLTLAQSQLAPQPLPTSEMYSVNQYSGGELGSSQGRVCVSQQTPVYERVLGVGQGFMGTGLTGEVLQLTNGARSQTHVDASRVHVVGGMGEGYSAQQGQHGLGCSQAGVGQVGGIPCLPAVHVSKGMRVENNARPDIWSKPRGKKQVRVDPSKKKVEGKMYSWDNGIKMAGSVGSAVAGLELSRSIGVPSEQRTDRYENVWKDPGLNSRGAVGGTEAVDKAGLGGARHVVVERPHQRVQVQSQQSWDGGHPGHNNSNCHDRLDIHGRNESAGQCAVGGGGPPGIVLRGNVGQSQSVYERSKEINGVCSKLDNVNLTWERHVGAMYYPESGQLQDQNGQ